MQKIINRHNARQNLNNCVLPHPPHFSLPSTFNSMPLPRPTQVPLLHTCHAVPRSFASYLCSKSLLARSRYRLRYTQTNISTENALFRQHFTQEPATVFAEHSRHLLHVYAQCRKTFTPYGPCEPVPKYFFIKIFFH